MKPWLILIAGLAAIPPSAFAQQDDTLVKIEELRARRQELGLPTEDLDTVTRNVMAAKAQLTVDLKKKAELDAAKQK